MINETQGKGGSGWEENNLFELRIHCVPINSANRLIVFSFFSFKLEHLLKILFYFLFILSQESLKKMNFPIKVRNLTLFYLLKKLNITLQGFGRWLDRKRMNLLKTRVHLKYSAVYVQTTDARTGQYASKWIKRFT